MHPARVARAKGFDYTGTHRYFLTLCTARRFPAFTSVVVVDPIRTKFLQLASDCCFSILAYCFMPDHLHLLVEGTSAFADLRRFVGDAKQSTGYWFKQHYRNPLWQVGYYDRVLRDDDVTLTVVRYVVRNPVEAGLVDDPTKYPFLGCPSLGGLDAVLEAIQFEPDWKGGRR